MRSLARPSCALVLALVLVTPAARGGGARIVDAPALPPFQSLQDAVDAATDGDTILVAGGAYDGGFTIQDKSLSIVAVPTQGVVVRGTIQVLQLAPQRNVLLSGLTVTGRTLPAHAEPGLIVTSSLGHVRIEGCTISGAVGTPVQSSHYGDGAHAVVLESSPKVAFAHCTIQGGDGAGGNSNCSVCYGGDGGFGVRVNSSAPAFYECSLDGGDGGTAGFVGGQGGHAVWQGNNWMFAAGSSFQGGRGGDAYDYYAAFAGDGGAGLFVEAAATAELLDNTFAGGLGGVAYSYPQNNGQPGSPLGGTGSATQHPDAARRLSSYRLLFDVQILQVAISGEPGDKVWLRIGQRPAFRFQASVPGVHLVQNSHAPLVPAGVIPASGELLIAVQVSDLIAQPAKTHFVQAFGFDALGQAWLGSPAHPVVLDLLAPPDCNSNQRSDIGDVLLASSPDCGPNLVPDECDPDCDGNNVPDDCDFNQGTHKDCNGNEVPDACDIALGASADCNANGVPDECDLASGFSPDDNGNGIPDECESNVTWWVDDSAPPGGNGSSGAPFQTVSQAVSAAIDGDEIVLRDGVYTGPGNRNVALDGLTVVVRSEHGPASCIFDLEDGGQAFQIKEVGAAARIEGIRFVDGDMTAANSSEGGALSIVFSDPTIRGCQFISCVSRDGGAILLGASGARIEDCVFKDNAAVDGFHPGSGGAIHVGGNQGAPPPVEIVSCTFLDNQGPDGGAVYIGAENRTSISHCVFLGNVASRSGGAIALRNSGSLEHLATLDDCLFAGNSAVQRGGAVFASSQCCALGLHAQFMGSTFVDNEAGIDGGALCVLDASFVRTQNCVVWGNAAPSGAQVSMGKVDGFTFPSLHVERCDVQGGQAAVFQFGGTLTWAAGNLDIDPQFTDPDGPDNNVLTFGDNNYRPIAGSPVNDAGDNALVAPDFNDMDGDGNTSEPTPLDLDLTPRFVEDLLAPNVGAGTPPLVDMGCFER